AGSCSTHVTPILSCRIFSSRNHPTTSKQRSASITPVLSIYPWCLEFWGEFWGRAPNSEVQEFGVRPQNSPQVCAPFPSERETIRNENPVGKGRETPL